MENKTLLVLEYLRENPERVKYKEIGAALNIGGETVKGCVRRLKNQGKLRLIGNTFEVLVDKSIKKSNYKKETLTKITDKLMEEFEKSSNLEEMLKVADIVLRIMIRM